MARIGWIIENPSGEPFQLVELIGRGAFGEVYRAVGLSSAQSVAIKLLPAGGGALAREALLNEIQAAAQINHPNVVRLLWADQGSNQIGPYMAMEYVEGETLKQLLARYGETKVPIGLAKQIMLQIAEGVSSVNRLMAHGDLKPDNILIEGSQLKISDMGLSALIGERGRAGAVQYMAPEIWMGAADASKADIYSAGLIFCEVLTLRNPVEQFVEDPGRRAAWEEAHCRGICPDVHSLRPEIDPPLSELISRMVAKSEEDRPDWDQIIAALKAEP
jgi:serine/threonine protein kinase